MYVYLHICKQISRLLSLFSSFLKLQLVQSPNLLSYRSPKRRPSPVPSPGYGGSTSSISTSFGESNISAPCSPASSHSVDNKNRYVSLVSAIDGEFEKRFTLAIVSFSSRVHRQVDQFGSNNDYYVNRSIQQHFEQFSLVRFCLYRLCD